MGMERRDRPLSIPASAWVRTGVLGVAFIVLFRDWFGHQALHSWEAMEDWGHAFIVPLISLYMVWQSREQIARTPASTFWPGLAPLLLGVVSYFFFVVGVPNHMLQGLAMILTLAGLCLLLLGPALFRFVFLPISFLLFAVMISEQIMIKVTFQLQHVAAVGAWLVLKLVSIPAGFWVDVDGNTLKVAGMSLNVAEACSGMRMVIAFIALAATVAVLSCRYWWQRVALILLATPVAVFNNVLRVAVLGLLSMRWPNLVKGQAHMLIGTILLVLGLAIFVGIQWALGKIVVEPEAGARREPQGGAA